MQQPLVLSLRLLPGQPVVALEQFTESLIHTDTALVTPGVPHGLLLVRMLMLKLLRMHGRVMVMMHRPGMAASHG